MLDDSWLTVDTTLILGHRGASADALENTLGAFALALEQGADGIELDVQLTADGHPVIFHDSTLQRLTGKKEKITALTLAELKNIDLGEGQTVPTLQELFEYLGPRTLYNIELKTFSLLDHGLEAAVADLVSGYSLEDRILISSFNPFAIRRARKVFPAPVPMALIRAPGLAQHTRSLVNSQGDNPHYSLVDEDYMAWAKKRGHQIYVWTVDDPAEARRLVNLGVQGIITNKPGLLRDLVS